MLGKYTAKKIKEQVATGQLQSTALYDYLYMNTGFEGTPIGAEIYRSDNGGATWKKVNEKELPINSTYGYYFGKIYVSPYNPEKVYATGFTSQYSTDGGKHWKSMDKPNVHPDHHALWIDPQRDSHLLNGNDGGVNITYDNGDHWVKANTPGRGAILFGGGRCRKTVQCLMAACRTMAFWYGPSTNSEGVSWQATGDYPFKSIMGGDGMQVQVDTTDNATTYTGFQFGNYSRLNRQQPRGTAKRITPTHPLGEKPYRFNWQTPVLLSPQNPRIVYFGGNKFFRSTNKADTLIATADLTRGDKGGNVPFGTITTITESPLRAGLLYAGTDDGNIQLSKDSGATWTMINNKAVKVTDSPLVMGLWISRVLASRFKEARVYATLSGYRFDDFAPYLYVSEDYGASWTQLGREPSVGTYQHSKRRPEEREHFICGHRWWFVRKLRPW